MRKIISIILAAMITAGLFSVSAYAENNFEYAEFTRQGDVQSLDNGFVVTKSDGGRIYFDKSGNETNDIVGTAGSNVFYINSENEDVNEYNPQTGEGFSYTRYYYYIYDNNNNLIARLPNDKYDIAELKDYIAVANCDENIVNITMKFYSKATGELISELPAADYNVGNTYDNNHEFDLTYLNETVGGNYFAFTDKNGLSGIADIYGNIIVQPQYHKFSIINYVKNYFSAFIGDNLCIIDRSGNIIKDFGNSFQYISEFEDNNNQVFYMLSGTDFYNHLLDEHFNEVTMPEKTEFAGFFGSAKHNLIRVQKIIQERTNDYYTGEALINFDGSFVIPFEANYGDINELGDELISARTLPLEDTDRFTILDYSGNVIINDCSSITNVGDNGLIGIVKDGKSFYINSKGETVLYAPDGYTIQGEFSEGLASVVKADNIVYGYGKTSYIDESGKIVIELEDSLCRGGQFKNGIAEINIMSDKEYSENTVYIKYNGNTPSEWAADIINDAMEKGILTESPAYRNNITREQFCELAYNMLDSAMNVNWKKASPVKFNDTYNEKVLALAYEGIINGKSDSVFAPDDTLTREEAAAILYRIAEYAKVKSDLSDTDTVYADDSEISDWAKSAVYMLNKLGIMQGTDKGFEPKSGYTAEQSVVTLMRLYNMINISDAPISDTPVSFADKLNAYMPKDKNYMFSPISVKTALAMAANGASGETRDEILDALEIDDLDNYNNEIKKLIEKYAASDLLKLSVSNSIWINKDNTSQNFSDKYKSSVKDIFGASAGTVTNYTALSEINGWVSKNTNGKIPTIISENNKDFWTMLVNAVYFKGRWMKEFNKNETKSDVFIDRNNNKNMIDFMNRTTWMQYAGNNGVQIVELPYQTREDKFNENGEYIETNDLNMDISMFVMMSDNKFNPESVLDSAQMSSKYVALSMPKFNIEYSSKINNILKNIGIKKAFDTDAEFNKMFDSGNMWITDTIHKTYIKVDEEGTEAAAVTALGMAGASLPPEPIEVKFNKPFTFVIRDNSSGEILFMGEYAFAE